jgi:hypothetical protein
MAGGVSALGNLPLKTDANGYLLVTISGGAITPTTVKTNSLTLDVANADIVLWRSAAKTLQVDTDGAGGALTGVNFVGPIAVTGSITATGAGGSFTSAGGGYTSNAGGQFGWSARSIWTSPADGKANLTNNNASAGIGLDVTTDGTVQIRNRAQTGAANLSCLKITNYNSVATVGQGVPSIYSVGSVSATTGTIAALCTMTVGASDGDFEVGGNIAVNTATTHNFTMACLYTDAAGTTRTATLTFALVAGTLTTAVTAANGTVPYMGISQRIHAKKTTVITVLTTGTVTTVNYDATANITQYQ